MLRAIASATGIIAVAIAGLSASPVPVPAPSQDSRAWQAAATSVWEQAIAAKGGRERLHSIRNLVVDFREDFSRSTRPDVATSENIEGLYVFPNKLWEFYDHRPGLMGASGLMLDATREITWGSNGYPAKNAYPDLVRRLSEVQYLYLMETASVQPALVGVKADRFKGTDVDVVETRVGDERVDFWIDRASHLPARVVSTRTLRAGAPLQVVHRLTDYQSIDGIQMAARVRTGDDETDKVSTTYRFNVDYDESIFNPESLRFETHGWMKR
jgi:hypothetical protein